MWPDDRDLPVEVMAAFGADLTASPASWSWTDLSARLRSVPITVRAGKSGGAGRVSPGTCSVTLDNDDGALTPLHPMSPYWPNVELGTPLRVRVQWGGVWYERFAGNADQWEPTYLPTGVVGQMSSAVRVTCSGILRRLQQGTPAVRSPQRRSIGAAGPVAYWPLEDGQDSSQAASAVPGHPPLYVTGAVEFVPVEDTVWGSATVRFGTAALLDLSGGGTVIASVPADVAAATSTAWAVSVDAAVDNLLVSGDVVVLEVATPGGTHVKWQLIYRASITEMHVVAYPAAGAPTTVIASLGVPNSLAVQDIGVWQSGANISVGYAWNGSSYGKTASVPGTMAGVAGVALNPGRATQSTEMPFGHLAVWPTTHTLEPGAHVDASGVVVPGPGLSWQREAATDRLARLCAEDGVPLAMPAVPAWSVQRMGWQAPDSPIPLYEECEAVDGGLIYESGFGLGYLPRAARYNAPVALTIDLATYAVTGRADVLDPVYDDQDIRNRWTVERRDGSSAVADDPVSQRRGVYSDSVELNLLDDSTLADHAGWRLHLDTVVDLREASFPIDLAANPGLIDGWLSCGVGSRIVRVNPPAQYRPGPLDRLVAGWTETIGPRSWMVQVTPEPASPWQVATADGPQRAGADGSKLAEAITASAASLQITSTASNGPWTTNPADMPLDIRVGGEQVRLSAITGTGLTQTATVAARAVNGVSRAWPDGTPVDVWQPAISPL